MRTKNGVATNALASTASCPAVPNELPRNTFAVSPAPMGRCLSCAGVADEASMGGMLRLYQPSRVSRLGKDPNRDKKGPASLLGQGFGDRRFLKSRSTERTRTDVDADGSRSLPSRACTRCRCG